MAEWRGIEYREYIGRDGRGASPSFQFGVDRSSTVKQWDIAWVDVARMCRQIIGHPEVKTSAGGVKFISRNTPHFMADYLRLTDGRHYQYATGVSGYGLNSPNRALPEGEMRMKSVRDTAQYDRARLTIQYETLPYEILTDDEMFEGGFTSNGVPDEATLARFVSVFPRPKGKFLGLVGSTFKFAGGPPFVPLPQPPGRIVPSWDLRITWHQIPAEGVPSILVNPVLQAAETLGAIDTALGKVNRSTFKNLAPGTLLLLPPEITPRRSARGDRIYDVNYYFEYLPFLHNRVPRVTGGVFAFVRCSADGVDHGDVSNDAGKLIYDSAEFAPLFRPPS